MSELDKEIQAYEKMRSALEMDHRGEWVIIHDGKLIGTYLLFDNAAENAVKKFGRGPYLIRRVGDDQITLPASVMYGLA